MPKYDRPKSKYRAKKSESYKEDFLRDYEAKLKEIKEKYDNKLDYLRQKYNADDAYLKIKY